MDILTIIFSGIAALCAFLSFVNLDLQELKTAWRIQRTIRKLGGAKEIKKMSGEELLENYRKKIGQEPILKDIAQIEKMTGSKFTFLFEGILRHETSLRERLKL